MANDRVFIKCEGCGGWKMLLKHFSDGLGIRDNNITEWIDAHCACHPNYLDGDLGGNPGFSLHTEDEMKPGGALSMEKQNIFPLMKQTVLGNITEHSIEFVDVELDTSSPFDRVATPNYGAAIKLEYTESELIKLAHPFELLPTILAQAAESADKIRFEVLAGGAK